jgi:uncharacterized membrane protein
VETIHAPSNHHHQLQQGAATFPRHQVWITTLQLVQLLNFIPVSSNMININSNNIFVMCIQIIFYLLFIFLKKIMPLL